MKRQVYKVGELPKDLSPITPKGELVFSTIREESDPHDPRNRWITELTPNAEEAIAVLKFLDQMNGIGWTSQLKKIEKELRAALHDLMAIKADKG